VISGLWAGDRSGPELTQPRSAVTLGDMIRGCTIVLLLLVLTALAAPAQSEETVTVPGRNRLTIFVPPGYSFAVERDVDKNAAVRMENPVWPITIAAFIIAEADPAIVTNEWQRNHLIASALPDAKEKDYHFQPLHPVSGSGVLCVFTDGRYKSVDELPAGEFLHLTGGVKAWRGCYVFFQIMSNDITSPEYLEALELFQTSFTK
jgi:hypothetical protein